MSQKIRKKDWIQRVVNKLLLEKSVKMMNMLKDNKTSLSLAKDLKSQNRTKHPDVPYHHVRQLVKIGKKAVIWIPSAMIFKDSFTEVLLVGVCKGYHEKWSLVE